ncbi:Membrane protein involved in Golgi transport [Acinetobacter johnsonii]|uniref:TipJ family phage tail tip protein n=1 Tax=Acinetobacter johnsonii TaxID=40214 RepID=UPI000B7C1217|nr:phage tail protein [Acinetobacter johnsonii]SNU14097.1 Membrane protein involved in Golgi transport [Acinetobacter johnsonii]
MNAVIKGAKGGSKSQRQPKIANDTTASKTYARLQYGMSEGEVEGLANGFKSIFLDDTPVESDSGARNFQDVTLDFRSGTNDQTYMEGFESIASEAAVGVELKSDTPWVKGITNLNLDAVIVRVRFGALKKQDPSNGDVSGIVIDYSIEVQTDGGAWELMLDTKMSGKTSPNYERTHRIGLPKANNNWLIRVTRKTPNSSSEYVSDKMYIQAITEVIDLKLTYPNTAVIGVQYDAETFSNIAKIAVDLKGVKIRVPSNYDPVSRTYIGIWDGTFKRAYSNNPAWIYYDLCTNKRYALGNRLTEQMIDKWSLYRLAQYCDQMVNDGKGGQEPRFTCNVYIQSAESAFDILSKLAGVFRAISYWDGNSIVCDADLPQDTYFTYTRANVIDGHFEYSGTRARDRHNAVKVAWDNPQNRYKTEYVFVRDEAAIARDRGAVKLLELEAWGCTSEGQAQRAGLWALKSEQLETQTVTFKVGLDGYIPLPGKVIEVADELLAGRANGGRISAVSTDRKIITLDRDDVVCRAGDRLVVNGEDGKAQARIVSSKIGRKVTVTVAFDSVAAENVWVVDAQDLKTMKFRVMSITQDEKHQFSITGLQYESAKYDAIDFGAFIDERPISIINPTIQAPVTNVLISSENMVQQGLSVETMLITWDQAQGATKYQVEWRKDDGNWIKLPITGSNSVEVQGIYAGNYEARVTAISAFDIASLPTYSVLTTLSGKQGLPPALANIAATGILFGYRLNWNFPAVGALDTAYTEIEIATTANGANAAQLGLFAYPTNSHVIQGMQPNLTRYFRGRLIDRIGNIGPWSQYASATTSADASAVLDILSGKITESQLHQNLQTKIDKIDTIAGLDGDIGNLIENISAVQTHTDQISDELALERQQRVTAIQDLDDGLTQEVLDRQNGETAIYGYVNTYKLSNDNALASFQDSLEIALTDSSLAIERTQALDGRVQVAEDEAGNALFNSASALQKAEIAIDDTRALSSLVTEVKAVAEQSANTADTAATGAASALEKATASATKSDANALKIEEITAELGTKASTGALNQTNANIQEVDGRVLANTTRLNGVYAQVNPDMIGSTEGFIGSTAGHVGTWTLQSAVIEGDEALSQRIDTTVAEISNTKALVQTEAYARAQEDEALSSRINTLKVDVDGNKAAIVTLETARATDNEAFAGRFDTLQASTKTAKDTADQAILDAQSKSAAAESAAKTYADAKAEAEADAAIAAASNDATAKANAAESAAKAAAALDAKNKADAALAAAKLDATEKANAATTAANAAQQAADAAATAAGNKGEVIFGSTTPAAEKRLPQNLWIDTTGGLNTPKRWNGSAWVAVTDKAATDAAAAAQAAQDTATEALDKADTATENIATIKLDQGVFTDRLDAIGGEIKTIQGYVDGQQTSIEVVSAVGDLNKLKNEIAKARLDEDITKLQGQSAALTSAINSYDARIAEITSKRTKEQAKEDKNQELIDLYTSQIAELNAAKIDANAQKDAISSQVAQITADKARLNSLVLTESKIKAQHTIKLDSDGVISSYGLAIEESGGTNYSNFVIRANSFALAGPASEGSTPYYPFIFRNTPYTDPNTGTVFPVGAYLKTAFMDYQSVKTSHIEDLAVKSGQIDDLAVKRGKIDFLAVGTGQIDDLAVNTLKIQDNAVTVPVSAFAEISMAVDGEYTTIQTLNVPSDMGHTILTFGAVFSFNSYTSQQRLLCRVLKNGNVVFEDLEVHFIDYASVGVTSSNSGQHQHGVNINVTGSASSAGGHNHSFSGSTNNSSISGVSNSSHSHNYSGNTGSSGAHTHNLNLDGSITMGLDGIHRHDVEIRGSARSAGTLNISRHDSTGIAGAFQLQLKSTSGGSVNVSQRYIHAMTMRK